MMPLRKFKCEFCGKNFESVVTEENKLKEYRETFGYTNDVDIDRAGLASLCDSCYKLFMEWYTSNVLKAPKDN